jgi:ESCRT-I complex subunit VPS37
MAPQPAVFHPWVDPSTGRVTSAPGLLNFSPHSDLGMVVQAVRRELEKAESLQPVPPPGGPSAAAGVPSDPVVARLAAMTEEELQEALESDVALEKLLLSLSFPPLQALEENIQSMQEVIKVTAETNIALEAEIEASRDALLCKVEEYHTCKLSLAQVPPL